MHGLCGFRQPFSLCDTGIPLGNAGRSGFCAGLFSFLCRATWSFRILCWCSSFLIVCRNTCHHVVDNYPVESMCNGILAVSSLESFEADGDLDVPLPLPFLPFFFGVVDLVRGSLTCLNGQPFPLSHFPARNLKLIFSPFWLRPRELPRSPFPLSLPP